MIIFFCLVSSIYILLWRHLHHNSRKQYSIYHLNFETPIIYRCIFIGQLRSQHRSVHCNVKQILLLIRNICYYRTSEIFTYASSLQISNITNWSLSRQSKLCVCFLVCILSILCTKNLKMFKNIKTLENKILQL